MDANTGAGGAPTDAATLAAECARFMWSRDRASQGLGMTLLRVAPGEAEIAMPVTERMLNGQDCCHGGFLFALADSAFAFACNGRNLKTVAQGCNIEFIRPAVAGQRLTALAAERQRGRRTGIYDVSVRNERDQLVALFRGKSFTLDEPLLEAAG